MNVILLRHLFLIINLRKSFLFLNCFVASDCLQLFVLNNLNSEMSSLSHLVCKVELCESNFRYEMIKENVK